MFLTNFLYKYPKYKKRPIFLAGESFAGHYIPGFVRMIRYYSNPEINLAGVAIGNGWVDPFY